MRGCVLVLLLAAAATPVAAQTLTAVRAIRPQTVIAASDLTVNAEVTPGALVAIEDAVGREAKVTLYPGRPILPSQIGAPARVERNQVVRMVYADGALSISAEGRTLDRGAAGERVRVMNLSSRQIVTGLVLENGSVEVSR